MSTLTIILLVLLVLLLVGSLPTWNHARSWGYGPSGLLGLVLVVVIVLLLAGVIRAADPSGEVAAGPVTAASSTWTDFWTIVQPLLVALVGLVVFLINQRTSKGAKVVEKIEKKVDVAAVKRDETAGKLDTIAATGEKSLAYADGNMALQLALHVAATASLAAADPTDVNLADAVAAKDRLRAHLEARKTHAEIAEAVKPGIDEAAP